MSDKNYTLKLVLNGIKYTIGKFKYKINVSNVALSGKYEEEAPAVGNYVKFTSDTAFTFSMNLSNFDGTMQYSLDNSTWNSYTSNTSISCDSAIYLRGSGATKIGISSSSIFTLTNATNVDVSGNLCALLDYENPPTDLSSGTYQFQYLFYNLTNLVNANNLLLPATTLANYCYFWMFRACKSLTSAPELPATTLASYCYSDMFTSCTSLTSAPALPATKLAEHCYNNMFNGTSLTSAPALPATTLKLSCYARMFRGCTSLTSAPELPATTLASECYDSMFYGCSSLTSAPALPATKLASYCYSDMFNGCTSLKLSTTQTSVYKTAYRIPTAGTGTTASNALANMFLNTGGTFKGTPTINTTYYGAW